MPVDLTSDVLRRVAHERRLEVKRSRQLTSAALVAVAILAVVTFFLWSGGFLPSSLGGPLGLDVAEALRNFLGGLEASLASLLQEPAAAWRGLGRDLFGPLGSVPSPPLLLVLLGAPLLLYLNWGLSRPRANLRGA